MQKETLRPDLAPIVLDADRGAVRQAKTGDVERPAQGVLAEVAAAVDRAAGKAAEVVDPDDSPAELGRGEGLHHLALEIVEPARQSAAHDGWAIKCRLDPADPHRGIDLATGSRCADRGQGAVTHILRGEQAKTSRPTDA